MDSETRARLQVGGPVDDYCRVCKMDRRHTVLAMDTSRTVIRVLCDSCGSQHNYRGRRAPASREGGSAASAASRDGGSATTAAAPPPLVSERERSMARMSVDDASGRGEDLELLLRRVIREETGLSPVAPAGRWQGGELVLRPASGELQEKSWPIETFFSKVVMVRNRLRTLEQQINAADLPTELKIKLQSYITGCYGSLTSFNVLFADDEDRFKGSGGR